jgi:hypothetical protein
VTLARKTILADANFGIFEKTTPQFDQVVGEVAAVHGK